MASPRPIPIPPLRLLILAVVAAPSLAAAEPVTATVLDAVTSQPIGVRDEL
jgi:hypothetical protein